MKWKVLFNDLCLIVLLYMHKHVKNQTDVDTCDMLFSEITGDIRLQLFVITELSKLHKRVQGKRSALCFALIILYTIPLAWQ